MVMSVLHIICGNCGNADKEDMTVKVAEHPDFEGGAYNEVYLTCKNCCTMHSLTDDFEIGRDEGISY